MLVKFGNWLFHYRNFLFPVFYLALFIPSSPFLSNTVLAEIAGIAIILCGMLIRAITIGLVYIVRGGRNRTIYADNLVTGGIYSVCRNPMYLGNILLLLGFGLFANSLWFMLIFFPLFVLFYVAIIRAEEAFLLNRFGKEFDTYKKDVNALIPMIGRIGNSFRGHSFKWKKVLNKEHNSLYVYIAGILLLLLFKERMEFRIFIILFVLVSILYGAVKWMKRNRLLEEKEQE
jgi:protein-S-isoprenylcysteine O-methyltransferase Ste14